MDPVILMIGLNRREMQTPKTPNFQSDGLHKRAGAFCTAIIAFISVVNSEITAENSVNGRENKASLTRGLSPRISGYIMAERKLGFNMVEYGFIIGRALKHKRGMK